MVWHVSMPWAKAKQIFLFLQKKVSYTRELCLGMKHASEVNVTSLYRQRVWGSEEPITLLRFKSVIVIIQLFWNIFSHCARFWNISLGSFLGCSTDKSKWTWLKTNSLSVFLFIFSLFQKRKRIYLVSYSPSKYATAIEFYVSFFLNILFLHNLAYIWPAFIPFITNIATSFLPVSNTELELLYPPNSTLVTKNDLAKENVNIHSSSSKYHYNFPVISRINSRSPWLIFLKSFIFRDQPYVLNTTQPSLPPGMLHHTATSLCHIFNILPNLHSSILVAPSF